MFLVWGGSAATSWYIKGIKFSINSLTLLSSNTTVGFLSVLVVYKTLPVAINSLILLYNSNSFILFSNLNLGINLLVKKVASPSISFIT